MVDPKELLSLIKSRRSIREYIEKEIPKDVLLDIMEAGRWAPTGANLQPWHFVLVTDKKILNKVGKAIKFFGIKEKQGKTASAMVVLCIDTLKGKRFSKIDIALCGANMIIMATAYGIGTCWIGVFDEHILRDELHIPKRFEIVSVITMGYYGKQVKPPPKLPLEKVLHMERWENTKHQNILDFTTKSGPLSVLKRIFSAVTFW